MVRLPPGSGTSFASPHVVGTVALLQQLVDRQLRAGVEHSSLAGRHPLVMKAVLLNSADKLKDEGDGQRLGMGRTLLDAHNLTWLDSDAYRDHAIPLHRDLGTGHLNAYRAYQQLLPGGWGPGGIPTVGWRYSASPEQEGGGFQGLPLQPIPCRRGACLSGHPHLAARR
jgi:subtilisin family serine protease